MAVLSQLAERGSDRAAVLLEADTAAARTRSLARPRRS